MSKYDIQILENILPIIWYIYIPDITDISLYTLLSDTYIYLILLIYRYIPDTDITYQKLPIIIWDSRIQPIGNVEAGK